MEDVKDQGSPSDPGDWLADWLEGWPDENREGLDDRLTGTKRRATPLKMKVYVVRFTQTRRPSPPGPAAAVTADPGG